MAWKENIPQSGDLLSEFPSVMTAQAVSLREGIEKHSFWTDSSGASAGIPRLSDGSFGPGAARAFYDVASNLSASLASTKPLAGRLYITSDTTPLRLFGFLSDVSVPLGSAYAIVYPGASTATMANNGRVLVQTGTASVTGSTTTVSFPASYSVAPLVMVTPLADSANSMYIAQVNASTTTCFGVLVRNVWGAAAVATTVLWRSHGTTTL